MYRVVNNLQGKGDSVECRGKEEEEMREREREREKERKRKRRVLQSLKFNF